ncbi:Transmembrane protein [Melia azedarach]|uniref:Transmembrane protein n=1 Tax=Melia azedarach TaxID=155640 RepID=A0ACC1YXQ5_MELAZ|nr:Transmembrane protein [Melia azedarach]
MGWQNLPLKVKNFLIQSFHILTINLLTLLLPLSFLLLARVSSAHYLLTIISYPSQLSSSFFLSVFLYTNPALLYILVSTVSVATLIHGLTGKLNIINESPGTVYRPRLYTAWIFLCTLQICVGLGIEGSIAAGNDGASFGIERSLLSRVIFFLGLHETMLLWYRMVVKPVVDDTIFEVHKEEGWVDRVAMALSFGGLWWWKLRDEVESLVVVPEVKKEMLMSVGVADFVGWWLYYLTVTIGMVRIVKALLWLVMIFLCRRRLRISNAGDSCDCEDDQDKV